jgi:autotransporter-associated beta strand protein
MNLNGQAPTFTVAAVVSTNTITGQITGSGGFIKAGPGLLTLTPGIASTFTGPVNVTGGLLTMGNANAFAGNAGGDYTIGASGEINIAGFALSIGSLSGAGILTNSSGTAQTLSIGNGANATNATFSGALVANTPANLLVAKVGTNTQALTGQSYYTGATTVNGGGLILGSGGNSP